MTELQQEFLRVVALYGGIADNGNLMAELGWPRKVVAAVGRALVRRGKLSYKPVDRGGFEGGVYEEVE